MGGLYVVQAIVLDEKMKKTFFNYEFYHLVVDDESSYCLPFVDAGENWFVYLRRTLYALHNNLPRVICERHWK